MSNHRVKVLVVDDSPVFRALLSEMLASDAQIDVVGMANDPYQAREMIKQLKPDVLTLDIEMPKMNGVQFLKNLMRLHPMPVVMLSTLTQHGAQATLMALELGAVDYLPKPATSHPGEILNYREEIIEKVKMAAQAKVGFVAEHKTVNLQNSAITNSKKIELIAIGASTGGTEAIKYVLSALPSELPPIVITQHISALFSLSFAQRLDKSSKLKVCQLEEGRIKLLAGHVYLAPGDKHMVIYRKQGQLMAEWDDRPEVNRHKPSVDVMFQSIAEVCAARSIAILLTGMGKDGAEGMKILRDAGATTIAQDEQSCVVWGMPRAAVEVGGVQHVKALNHIPKFLCTQLS